MPYLRDLDCSGDYRDDMSDYERLYKINFDFRVKVYAMTRLIASEIGRLQSEHLKKRLLTELKPFIFHAEYLVDTFEACDIKGNLDNIEYDWHDKYEEYLEEEEKDGSKEVDS